jgi:hypothetical protein
MSTRPDQRGWTAARQLGPCVLCGQPAILRSPRGRPCHWTCATTWTRQHGQDRQQEKETHPRDSAA